MTKLINRFSRLLNKNSEHCSLFLFVLILVPFISACQDANKPQQYVFSGPIMGTEYRVSVVSVNEENGLVNQKQLAEAIVNAMQAVNKSMSNYLSESELSRFNRLEANTEFQMSDDFSLVMQESQAISELSDGAFDVTLAKAIDAWGFGPKGTVTQKPTTQELQELKKTIGYKNLLVDGNTLQKTMPKVEISLSAIAKGYAVDKVANAIESLGYDNYLVNIGGELRALGNSIDGVAWRVGIEKPHILGGIQQVISLENQAIATSGDYRNYLLIDGETFSHTIDPKTLMPVLHKLALVSVVSDKASTADALATAMMVMGEDKAWSFAQKNKIASYFVVRGKTESDFSIKFTKEFERILQ